MTRYEAVQILADLTDNPFLHTWEEQYKALHMAIETLQEVDELEKIIKELADEDYQRQLWRDYKSLL